MNHNFDTSITLAYKIFLSCKSEDSDIEGSYFKDIELLFRLDNANNLKLKQRGPCHSWKNQLEPILLYQDTILNNNY